MIRVELRKIEKTCDNLTLSVQLIPFSRGMLIQEFLNDNVKHRYGPFFILDHEENAKWLADTLTDAGYICEVLRGELRFGVFVDAEPDSERVRLEKQGHTRVLKRNLMRYLKKDFVL